MEDGGLGELLPSCEQLRVLNLSNCWNLNSAPPSSLPRKLEYLNMPSSKVLAFPGGKALPCAFEPASVKILDAYSIIDADLNYLLDVFHD